MLLIQGGSDQSALCYRTIYREKMAVEKGSCSRAVYIQFSNLNFFPLLSLDLTISSVSTLYLFLHKYKIGIGLLG